MRSRIQTLFCLLMGVFLVRNGNECASSIDPCAVYLLPVHSGIESISLIRNTTIGSLVYMQTTTMHLKGNYH